MNAIVHINNTSFYSYKFLGDELYSIYLYVYYRKILSFFAQGYKNERKKHWAKSDHVYPPSNIFYFIPG